MFNMNNPPVCPYLINRPMYNANSIYAPNPMLPYPYAGNAPMYSPVYPAQPGFQHMPNPPKPDHSLPIKLKDYGPEPFAVNIDQATKQNNTFRTALWTGNHLQLTLMSINVGEDIGLEIHHDVDQFIRIEDGEGVVMMGDREDKLDFQARVSDGYAFIIPAGTWHNLINTGYKPIKLYSIYAPPQHPHGTVHVTKAEAEAAEASYSYQ